MFKPLQATTVSATPFFRKKRGESQGQLSNVPCKIRQGDLGKKTGGFTQILLSPFPSGLLKMFDKGL